MKPIEYRPHDHAGWYRVWTEEDAAYGSFTIVTAEQLRMIVRANRLMRIVVRPAKGEAAIDMAGYRPEDGLPEHVLRNEQLGSS
ncbi:MAG: hypothetical protein JO261_11490 [Alphaproteobacteria bacterium]|nr:hypothetical protein [Alphaproteobacteria bacterium]